MADNAIQLKHSGQSLAHARAYEYCSEVVAGLEAVENQTQTITASWQRVRLTSLQWRKYCKENGLVFEGLKKC